MSGFGLLIVLLLALLLSRSGYLAAKSEKRKLYWWGGIVLEWVLILWIFGLLGVPSGFFAGIFIAMLLITGFSWFVGWLNEDGGAGLS